MFSQVEGMRGYSGHFGAGKTLEMTKDLYDVYKTGKALIITNYTTTFSHIVCYKRKDFMRLLIEIFFAKDQKHPVFQGYEWVFIGLDEGGIYFNSQEWQKFREEFKNIAKNDDQLEEIQDELTPNAFFLQLRKMQVMIYYTVQQPQLMDVTFRRITPEWCIMLKFLPYFKIKGYGEIPPESPKLESIQWTRKNTIYSGRQLGWFLYDTKELVKYIELNDIQINYEILTTISELNYKPPPWYNIHIPTFYKYWSLYFKPGKKK